MDLFQKWRYEETKAILEGKSPLEIECMRDVFLNKENLEMLDLNKDNWEKEMRQSSIPIIVCFYATWCYSCGILNPILNELSKKYDGKIKFAKVVVDDNMDLTASLNIKSVPSLLFFCDSKIKKCLVGVMTKEKLDGEIEQCLLK